MRTGCPSDIQGVTSSLLLFVFQQLLVTVYITGLLCQHRVQGGMYLLTYISPKRPVAFSRGALDFPFTDKGIQAYRLERSTSATVVVFIVVIV